MAAIEITTGGILAGLLVSSLGTGLFIYGRKQRRWPQLAGGVALFIVPCLSASALPMLALGGGVIAGVWWLTRAGF
jgi:hypothetical protein